MIGCSLSLSRERENLDERRFSIENRATFRDTEWHHSARPFFIPMTFVHTVPCPAWMTVIRGAHTNQAQPYHIPSHSSCMKRIYVSRRNTRRVFEFASSNFYWTISTCTYPDHVVLLFVRGLENFAPVSGVHVVWNRWLCIKKNVRLTKTKIYISILYVANDWFEYFDAIYISIFNSIYISINIYIEILTWFNFTSQCLISSVYRGGAWGAGVFNLKALPPRLSPGQIAVFNSGSLEWSAQRTRIVSPCDNKIYLFSLSFSLPHPSHPLKLLVGIARRGERIRGIKSKKL